ncbi:MAG: hypothetical protein RIF41_03150 [Polyangiaceae bacterium]
MADEETIGLDPARRAALAARLGGEVVAGDFDGDRAPPVELPEFHDRVCFEHRGVALAYYVSHVERGEVGPAIAEGFYTRLMLTLAPDRPAFHIIPETLWTRLTRKLGAQDIETGDAAYDAAFMIKCDAPEWLKGCLSSSFRALHLDHPDVIIRHLDHRLEALHDHRAPDTPAAVEGRAETLVELAMQLQRDAVYR